MQQLRQGLDRLIPLVYQCMTSKAAQVWNLILFPWVRTKIMIYAPPNSQLLHIYEMRNILKNLSGLPKVIENTWYRCSRLAPTLHAGSGSNTYKFTNQNQMVIIRKKFAISEIKFISTMIEALVKTLYLQLIGQEFKGWWSQEKKWWHNLTPRIDQCICKNIHSHGFMDFLGACIYTNKYI